MWVDHIGESRSFSNWQDTFYHNNNITGFRIIFWAKLARYILSYINLGRNYLTLSFDLIWGGPWQGIYFIGLKWCKDTLRKSKKASAFNFWGPTA